MFKAVSVLLILSFHKSLINCFPDLTPEAITVYRNPEFFKNLYYEYDKNDETATESAQGEEIKDDYKYPGETTRPNTPRNSPGFEVTYDDSPEFHHDPRDVSQGPFTPSRRRGPYGPLKNEENDEENVNEKNYAENYEESTLRNSEKNFDENLEENDEKNSEDNTEESTEINSEDSGEYSNRDSNDKDETSEENVEDSSKDSEEGVNTDKSIEDEKVENKEEAEQESEDNSSNENSEEIPTSSPHSLVTPDEELEAKIEPVLLAQSFNPDLSKSIYNQPYSFNATHPILYEDWKHYNYPKIYSRDSVNFDFVPLYSEEPSSNVFEVNNPKSKAENSEEEEASDSFGNLDTKDMGADSKHIYKKLLQHKKLKPSLLFKYHSKPKLKKLKLKLKKGKHDIAWFDQYPFNF